ncbi:hypothetical protein [Marinomonas transparens]|uniref:Uncharacterized protein n=1 Tax=Marinomonas transparens TaxID=2795388 RepID=A0A934MVJ1_9GAMM|nr:hypothetical protein [Marinomonas transparens]MBJ7537084.1 hypothetical protein [Marinomonas transparens]
MHTVMVIACGGVILALFVTLSKLWHLDITATPWGLVLFCVIWIVISLINMYMGISKAGYSLQDELYVLPQVLLTPIVLAYLNLR